MAEDGDAPPSADDLAALWRSSDGRWPALEAIVEDWLQPRSAMRAAKRATGSGRGLFEVYGHPPGLAEAAAEPPFRTTQRLWATSDGGLRLDDTGDHPQWLARVKAMLHPGGLVGALDVHIAGETVHGDRPAWVVDVRRRVPARRVFDELLGYPPTSGHTLTVDKETGIALVAVSLDGDGEALRTTTLRNVRIVAGIDPERFRRPPPAPDRPLGPLTPALTVGEAVRLVGFTVWSPPTPAHEEPARVAVTDDKAQVILHRVTPRSPEHRLLLSETNDPARVPAIEGWLRLPGDERDQPIHWWQAPTGIVHLRSHRAGTELWLRGPTSLDAALALARSLVPSA